MLGARCSVLGALFITLTVNSLSSQNEIFCGVQDMPRSEYQALLDGIGPMPAGTSSMTINIPIWFNVVREATPGYLGFPGWEAHFSPMQMLSEINGFYSSTGIQFYLCGTTQIFSDNFVQLNIETEANALTAQAKLQNPNYDNVINVFLVTQIVLANQSIGGLNAVPTNSSVGAIYSAQAGSIGARTIAHEMGHYFTLPHTFNYGPLISDLQQPWLAQYVDNEVTFILNGVSYTKTCHDTGDGFCDTPADPTQLNLGSYCGYTNNCDALIACTPFPNDPLGVPYNPDPSLLMGYSFGCGNRFSEEQAEQMRNILLAHPSWMFLTDTDEPTCQNLTSSDRGYLLRNCSHAGGAEQLTPFTEFSVPFEDANSLQCGSPVASTNIDGRYLTFSCVYPYTGSGLLSILPEIDHPSPIEGVTVYDLVLINKHILGIEPLDNPFLIIAADATNSGSITTFDILELRKLILGIYTELPNNSSWRFVPDYCFNDPNFNAAFNALSPFTATWVNPDEPIPAPPATNKRTYGSGTLPIAPNGSSWMDHVTLDPTGVGAQNPDAWSFWGIKVGDVNCSASIDQLSPEDPDDLFTTLAHAPLSINQVFTLQVKATGSIPVSAWQLGIEFAEDSLQILQIQSGNSGQTFSQDNFGLTGVEEGNLRALNFSETGTGTNLNDKTIFKLVIKALKPIADIGQHFRLKNSVLSEKFYSIEGNEVENMGLQLEVVTGLGNSGGGTQLGVKDNVALAYNLSTYPNPFDSELTFDFFLPIEEQIHLSVFDCFGRLILEKNESRSKGAQSIKLNNLSEQPVGLYWYSLKAGAQLFFGKISKQ